MARKKIKINGTITSDSNASIYRWFGLTVASPKMIADALEEAAGEPVDIYINSPGGSVAAGSEMYTLIKEYEGETTAKITGFAASAASLPAVAADKTLMAPTAQMMIHNSWVYSEGDRNNHTHQAKTLLSIDQGIAAAYSGKTGKTPEELMSLMDMETWMNAQKAVELGFADSVMFSEEEGANASNSAEKYAELPQAVIDKIRLELAKTGSFEDFATAQHFALQKNEHQGAEGEDEPMDLEELKAKHPEVYQAAVQDGVANERARITALNALATAPGAAEIVAKAIADGKTAGEAAIDIVKASNERLTDEGRRRQADAKNSGIEQVPPDEAPDNKNDPDVTSQAEADAIVAEYKNLRGGR
ncbi:head maturation protease, ClpP-related [Paenibacillus contaminans]|nr:head maturation protease, ClpP-related [Paenibacillus contaminans]